MGAATTLLFVALAFSQAQQGAVGVAFHGLAASSRAAVAAATRSRAPLFLPHEASFLVVQSGGHARRLLDAPDQSGETIPSCAAELPCVQKLLALQQNQTAFAAITNASNCPMQPADADKCFYAQVMACSNASSASPGFSGSSCGKNRSPSFGAPGNSGFNATPGFSFGSSGPCGGFFNASGAPRGASGSNNAPGTPSGNAPFGQQRSSGDVEGHEDGFGGNSSCPPPFNNNGTGGMTGNGSLPVCARAMSPSDAFQPCAQAAITKAQAQAAGRMLKAMPPATSNCSAAGGGEDGDAMERVAMTFPCIQTLVRSYTTAQLSFLLSNATTPVCSSPEYACNCFATIATTCPELNVTSMNLTSSDNHTQGEHNDCGGGNDDESSSNEQSMSSQCDAFQAVMALTNGFVASCPANFFESGAVIVLTNGTAVVPPVVPTELPVLPPLSTACAAVLGVSAPRPPATTAPVALVAAAVTLSGYTAETFTPALRAGFVTAISTMLNVDAADVAITHVKNASAAAARSRRAVLAASGSGVTVEFTVAAPTTEAGSTTSTDISALSTTDAAAFTVALQSQGLSDVTDVQAASAPVQVAAPSGAACTTATATLALIAAGFVVAA